MSQQSINVKVLSELFSNKQKYKINEKVAYQGIPDNEDGVQGQYNEKHVYYRHPEMPDNLFMREIYQTDSYGYDEHLCSVSFVEGKEKTITIYEPIN